MAFFKKIEIKGEAAEIINHLFQSLLVLYLVLLLIEQIWPGTVSFYFNLNYLLAIVIIAGILDVFSEHKITEKEKPNKFTHIFIYILGVLGFAIIKYKTSQLGWLSWVVSITSGILIILLSLLVLEEDEETEMHELNKKEKTGKNKRLVLVYVAAIIILLGLILGVFTSLTILESFRIILGSVYVLFLPGFIISYIFFPKTKDFESEEEGVDWIERIALSFALSIAVVPLAVFYLNLVGVRINLLNSFLTVLGIIILSLGILYYRKRNQHKY